MEQVRAERRVHRGPRQRHGLPIISIVGYTNAGKSTLLNTLTRAEVLAENRLFATLDPTSRRLRFPREREVIITDTVGFIRDLPKDLLEAFKATLEELEDVYDLLLHVIDLSNPRFEEQMEAVDNILRSLDLNDKPVLKVFNKVIWLTRSWPLGRAAGTMAWSSRPIMPVLSNPSYIGWKKLLTGYCPESK